MPAYDVIGNLLVRLKCALLVLLFKSVMVPMKVYVLASCSRLKKIYVAARCGLWKFS